MKQFLAKAFEVLRQIFRVLIEFGVWLIALLRSVNIDQPRGVLLCLALQLITIMVFLTAFRRDTEPLSRPVAGQQSSASPDTADGVPVSQ